MPRHQAPAHAVPFTYRERGVIHGPQPNGSLLDLVAYGSTSGWADPGGASL
jgi:hypothetical protein